MRSETMRAWLFGCLAMLLALAQPVAAHHSTANYDFDKTAKVTGVVTYIVFTNPHSFIDMDVTAADGTKQYKIFATSKVALLRYGWRPDSVKPGDSITVAGRPDCTHRHRRAVLSI